MGELKTAILGCGPRAVAHATAYKGVKTGSLVACCDLNQERLSSFSNRFGLQPFMDLGQMMETVKPDLLHIVTAPSVRWPVVEIALRYRPKAILLEKPLAPRPGEGYRILNACKAAGTHLFVNHQLRHHEPFQRLRAVVQSGELGPIERVVASCRGNLLEQGTHLFDLVSFVLDDVPAEWVFAQAEGVQAYQTAHSAPAYSVGVVCFTGGIHVAFECGATAPTWRQESNFWLNKGLEVIGVNGRAGASTNHGWWAQTASGYQAESVPYGEEDERAQGRLTETILASLAESPDAVAAHYNSPARSQISFDIVMAAQRSALRRAKVMLGEGPVEDSEIESLRAAL